MSGLLRKIIIIAVASCNQPIAAEPTWIILWKGAVRSPDDDVVGLPGELLDVRTVVGQNHRAAVIAGPGRRHLRHLVKVLVPETAARAERVNTRVPVLIIGQSFYQSPQRRPTADW